MTPFSVRMRVHAGVLLALLGSCQWMPGPPPETCVPVPSPETRTRAAGWGDRSWHDQVEDIRKGVRELEPQLILIGDSITQSWGGGGRQVGGAGGTARESWLDPLGPVLNAGISGDRTQHVFWRIETGTLQGADPAAIVLMIGTNNLPHDSAEDIAQGIELILRQLLEDMPEATLLLVSCPPRGELPEDPMRVRGADLNRRLETLAETLEVRWLDLAPLLLDDTGRALGDRMAGDFVHFSAGGYEAVAQAVAASLSEPDADLSTER